MSSMLIALLVPIVLRDTRFHDRARPSRDCRARVAEAGDAWARRGGQFLRHARHRVLRTDHRLAQIPPTDPGPTDPADHPRRPDGRAVVESVIFLLQLGVKVDPVLLVGCILACPTGGLIGAPLVHKTRVWIVQFIVAIGLTLAAVAYALTNLHLMPGGGMATSLPVALTIVAIAANFVFGVLLNLRCRQLRTDLVILSLMGMDPQLCFPIMAGAAALMGTTASIRHIKTGNLDLSGWSWPDRRRHTGGVRRRLPRYQASNPAPALAGIDRCPLRGGDHAARGDSRTARASAEPGTAPVLD